MEKQIIVSIGREYGSGGHDIAERIATHYNIPLYDKNILAELEKEKGMDLSAFDHADEKRNNVFLSRTVNGYNNSPEAGLAHMQFEFLKSKADSGASFVVCGRCAEHVLKDNPNLVSVFILADEDKKIERIMQLRGCTEHEAEHEMRKNNKKRKEYHNLYCEGKWGDSRNYDLSVNVSRLGMEKTADFLIDYIDKRNAE